MVIVKHNLQQKKLQEAVELFEKSPFNSYCGPGHPELLIITGRLFPLQQRSPRNAEFAKACRDFETWLHLASAIEVVEKIFAWRLHKIMIVEEVLPFLEENIKVAAMGMLRDTGIKTFYGKMDETLPSVGELNPDIVATSWQDNEGQTQNIACRLC